MQAFTATDLLTVGLAISFAVAAYYAGMYDRLSTTAFVTALIMTLCLPVVDGYEILLNDQIGFMLLLILWAVCTVGYFAALNVDKLKMPHLRLFIALEFGGNRVALAYQGASA